MNKRFFSAISFSPPQKCLILQSITFLHGPGLLLNGCYANKFVSGGRDSQPYLTELNASFRQKTAQVELVNGKAFTGKAIDVNQDSTFWEDREDAMQYIGDLNIDCPSS